MNIFLLILEISIYLGIIGLQIFVGNTLYRYWKFLLPNRKRNYIGAIIGGFFGLVANYMIFH